MNRESRIGLFVLLALAVMVFFILRTSDIGKLFRSEAKTREVLVALEDASGMREQTSVEIAGVKVGKVLGVELQNGKPVARISLPADLVLRQGANAETKGKGILGDRFMALNPGSGVPLADQDHLSGSATALPGRYCQHDRSTGSEPRGHYRRVQGKHDHRPRR